MDCGLHGVTLRRFLQPLAEFISSDFDRDRRGDVSPQVAAAPSWYGNGRDWRSAEKDASRRVNDLAGWELSAHGRDAPDHPSDVRFASHPAPSGFGINDRCDIPSQGLADSRTFLLPILSSPPSLRHRVTGRSGPARTPCEAQT